MLKNKIFSIPPHSVDFLCYLYLLSDFLKCWIPIVFIIFQHYQNQKYTPWKLKFLEQMNNFSVATNWNSHFKCHRSLYKSAIKFFHVYWISILDIFDKCQHHDNTWPSYLWTRVHLSIMVTLIKKSLWIRSNIWAKHLFKTRFQWTTEIYFGTISIIKIEENANK